MTSIPHFETVLTGGPQALVPLPVEQRRYFAALAENNPPTTAHIVYTSLNFPARLKAQLRENLKHKGVTVVGQQEISPEEMETIYNAADYTPVSTDIDTDRHRENVMALLNAAVTASASDVHIVRRRRSARVSFRINGQIITRSEWSDADADNTCRFIYEILAHDQAVTWNPREPQDAVVDTALNTGTRVRVRVGTIPASPDGYDMVLRILPAIGESMPLAHLGYPPDQLAIVRKLVRRPSGLVLMAGGVGSGKSTSLVGMLHEELAVHDQMLRIITVEDPPERIIPNATQVPVIRAHTTPAGDEFLSAIRGALRCDPDTLMVGEIRDRPAAQLVIKFAQSGHRVYTTVHAASALGVVGRLTSIGIDPILLCTPDVLKGMIYQTLVPVLCESCKVSATNLKDFKNTSPRLYECIKRTHSALTQRNLSFDKAALRGTGCNSCGQAGIIDRTLISEIVVPDADMLRCLAAGDHVAAWQHWTGNGGQPVIEHGINLIADGTASPDDVEWRIGHLDSPHLSTTRKVKVNGHAAITSHA